MADKENKVEEVVEEVKEAVGETAEKAKETAKETVEKAKEAAEKVEEKAKEAAEKVEEKAKETADKAKEVAKETVDKAKEAAEKVEEKAKETAEKAKKKVKEAKEKVEGKKGKGGLIGIICGAVVLVAVVALLIVAFVSGSSTISKYKAGDYDGAYGATKMAWFMNKSDKDLVTQAYVTNVLCAEGKYLEGAQLLSKATTLSEDSLQKVYDANPLLAMCVEGAIAKFGTWEQNGDNTEEEPIEWIVLEVRKAQGQTPAMALLLSKDVIGFSSVRSKGEGNTDYGKSEIHGWCETDFYKTLNGDETVKGKILAINVHTDPSSTGVESGEDVEAHVFAPSKQDLEKYIIGNEAMEKYLAATGNPAIKKQGAKVAGSGAAGYWLRNAGESDGFASAVTSKGELVEGSSMSSAHGIRPMMWVRLG